MIKIVRAKPSECQKVRRFEQMVWDEPCITSPWDIMFFVSYGYVFLAKEKEKIVGAIVAFKTKNDEVKITDWLVAKKYRRTGVGTKLYKRLKKDTKGMPIIAFVESKNTASLEGHKKLGFRCIKEVKDPFYLGEKKIWSIMKNLG
ncbi:MAG: hypothetical protein COV59_01290 [Candidatus Magasanikbacteria bacterium CG11_big_fil_rev_8_21_14_0_20_39_34]|uniref:N-acetyltransferase domain-containing protein n=1 Tax=Candidatus Magasanikbacteria bacterium CG11_big_fil_rev_8_21_14_0_20_39_34 TaxID=1974653 RepID=A0A2H0N616_9BACT|nr:MAG: hypothetical protein COV59_01290 [Candidatus Magasanikbacteria bacterium CG11_big_fil_rev_8_21_14_0_20_39_34]